MLDLLKHTVGAVVATLMGLTMALNYVSGSVSGAWLLFLGEWRTLVLGLLMACLMPPIFAFVSLPGMGIGMLGNLAAERGWKGIAGFLGLLFAFVQLAQVVGWVVLTFVVFLVRIKGHSPIPFLLWGYSTALAPLGYMASKDSPDDSPGTGMALVIGQISYLTLAALWYFEASFNSYVCGMAIVLSVGSLVMWGLFLVALRSDT